MYLEHFGLKELPFSITPDTSYFMNRSGYQDGLNVLLVAIRSGEGFIKVTGEVGTGKTLLCRKLLNTLGDDYVTAYIPNPYLKPATLFLSIADELKVRYAHNTRQHTLLKNLRRALINFHEKGKRVIVCMDEVQAMPVETLETLRLLTNLETEKSKLIQVVLFGQPELDLVLEQPSVRQLRQRITFAYQLMPLNREALSDYLSHRLVTAGYCGEKLFEEKTIDILHRASRGIPRLVNILSHKSMMAAFGVGEKSISRRHVRLAIEDTEDACKWQKAGLFDRFRSSLGWALAGVVVLAMLSTISLLSLDNMVSWIS